VVSLIAATGLVTFCLDTKSNQKNQANKILPCSGPDSQARVCWQAFARFSFSLHKSFKFQNDVVTKKSASAQNEKGSGPGVWLCGGKHSLSLDLLVTFGSSQK
jgi:hypothetical protein